jgi:hypothetical protein
MDDDMTTLTVAVGNFAKTPKIIHSVQCISASLSVFRTNNDDVHIQNEFTGFYNPDGVGLGTEFFDILKPFQKFCV